MGKNSDLSEGGLEDAIIGSLLTFCLASLRWEPPSTGYAPLYLLDIHTATSLSGKELPSFTLEVLINYI